MNGLRNWQDLALRAWYPKRTNFLLEACPGAGKTRFALEAAMRLVTEGKVSRVVFVVPSRALVEQTVDAARQFGLRVKALDNGQGVVPSDYHGFVTTYQSVCSSPEIVKHQIADAERTMVVLDEVHHVGDQKSWGDRISDVFSPVGFRLLMTGTPFRTDGKRIPFAPFSDDGVLKPDFSHDFKRAWEDKQRCIRIIDHHMVDCDATWIRDGQTRTISGEEINTQDEEALFLRCVRSNDSEWLDDILERGRAALEATRENQLRAQGLILAPGIQSANYLATKLNDLGITHSVVHGELDRAHKRLETFGKSSEDFLIAVNMVSEGYDNPRLTTLIYLSAAATQLAFRQAIGRVIRRNGPEDLTNAQVFVPNSPTFCEFVDELEDDLRYAVEESEEIAESIDKQLVDQQSEIELLGAENPRLVRTVRSGQDASAAEFMRRIQEDPGFLAWFVQSNPDAVKAAINPEWAASKTLTIEPEPIPSMREVAERRERNQKRLIKAAYKWMDEWEVDRQTAIRMLWVEVNRRLGQPNRNHRTDADLAREREIIDELYANGLPVAR